MWGDTMMTQWWLWHNDDFSLRHCPWHQRPILSHPWPPSLSTYSQMWAPCGPAGRAESQISVECLAAWMIVGPALVFLRENQFWVSYIRIQVHIHCKEKIHYDNSPISKSINFPLLNTCKQANELCDKRNFKFLSGAHKITCQCVRWPSSAKRESPISGPITLLKVLVKCSCQQNLSEIWALSLENRMTMPPTSFLPFP